MNRLPWNGAFFDTKDSVGLSGENDALEGLWGFNGPT